MPREDVAEDAVGLRIYDTTIEMIRCIAGFARRIERADADLARRMRRASASVTLNLAEGMHSQGRNRESRLFTAMGSAKETLACVDVAVAAGYLPERDATRERDRLDHIVATIYVLVHRPKDGAPATPDPDADPT